MVARTAIKAPPPKWTEASIGKVLAEGLFMGKSILAIPCCNWTGHEADLLVIERNGLRIIDVEIKISRSDLKADIKKDKWWKRRTWSRSKLPEPTRQRAEWPPKVWKHYYAMPAEIWKEELMESIPATSGVLLLHRNDAGYVYFTPKRHAKPNNAAKPIGPSDCIDLARLAGLRMWRALAQPGSME